MNSFTSVSSINWQEKQHSSRYALLIEQKFHFSPNLAKILAIKNIQIEEVEQFLSPTIKQTLPNPFDLLDMQKGVDLIIDKIKKKQKIVIFGDYDVDGATSSALLKRFFEMLGIEVSIYIPDRIKEGYGPNLTAFQKLQQDGFNLIITVDCGTSSFEPISWAKKNGLEVIVIDHHLGSEELPEAAAIINPNRLDEFFSEKNIAAVGVCFFLIVALNSVLKKQNFYSKNNLQPPNIISLLDLVALGTVCDVMPLKGINRTFVYQGLKIIKHRQNAGIKALSDLAGINEEPASYHLGFTIGPRINAGGRVGRSDFGAKLLASNDSREVEIIAKRLDEFNSQRKFIEQKTTEEAITEIEKNQLQKKPVIFVAKENWHSGVIGIVASRIKEAYNKPAVVIALENGLGKASCRSINGVNFGAAVLNAKLAGFLVGGGGHAMAAGFSVEESKISDLSNFICTKLAGDVAENSKFITKYFYDILDINSANMALAYDISKLEPYGVGNQKPRFIFQNLRIEKFNLIGIQKNHISCIFSSNRAVQKNSRIKGISFGSVGTKIGDTLVSKKNVTIAGQLSINHWQGGRSLQIVIEDVI